MKAVEYLSNDILEESFLRSFYPFRLVQMFLGSSRIDARDRFVTAPTNFQKTYTLICLIVCFCMYTSSVIQYFNKLATYTNIYYITMTSIYIQYILYMCTVINTRFFNNEENVKFYVQLQKIDRKLKIDKNKYLNDIAFLTNVLTVAIILILLTTMFIVVLLNDNNLIEVLSFSGFLWAHLSSTMEWLFCSNILLYFYIRVCFINAIITNHLEGTEHIKNVSMKKHIFPSTKVLRYIASDTHDFRTSDTDVYLTDLCEELIQFQNLYRFQIFLFCFKFISGVLINFEYGLLALQENMLHLTESVALLVTIFIDLCIVVFICVRSEAFSRQINNTKYLCITVLSRYYDGPLRKKAIKMLKMIKQKPPRISVYDMWYMDASTMIKMINLVTSLMVTLLQFALL